MSNGPNPWKADPNKVATLRELWLADIPPAQIAQELGGGISRNAVIGKAHRLQLPVHTIKTGRLRNVPLTTALIDALRELDECLDFTAGWPACRCFPAIGDINKAFDKARIVLARVGKW